MKLHIEDKRTLAEIQEEFNKAFPFLKLEFFKKPHAEGELSPMNEMIPAGSLIVIVKP